MATYAQMAKSLVVVSDPSQAGVWAFSIVGVPPDLSDPFGRCQVVDRELVQGLIAQSCVKRLDESVLHGLPRGRCSAIQAGFD